MQPLVWYYNQVYRYLEYVRTERVSLMPVVLFCVSYPLFVNLVAYIRRRRDWRTGRTTQMDPKSPHRRQQIVVADLVEDGLDQAVAEGKLTVREARYWARLFGQHCNLPDLLRGNNSVNQSRPAVVKAKQQRLLWELRKKRAEGVHDQKVVVLPGHVDVTKPDPGSMAELLFVDHRRPPSPK